jgi:hypothetical protein
MDRIRLGADRMGKVSILSAQPILAILMQAVTTRSA